MVAKSVVCSPQLRMIAAVHAFVPGVGVGFYVKISIGNSALPQERIEICLHSQGLDTHIAQKFGRL